MPKSTLDQIAPFVAGNIEDRINMQARRSLIASKDPPKSQGSYGRPTRSADGSRGGSRGASLAEQLLLTAVPMRTDGVVQSIAPASEDWMPLGDFPPAVQQYAAKYVEANAPPGFAIAGFRPSQVKDPEQRKLLEEWNARGQMFREQRLQEQAMNDPKFQQQLAMLTPEE